MTPYPSSDFVTRSAGVQAGGRGVRGVLPVVGRVVGRCVVASLFIGEPFGGDGRPAALPPSPPPRTARPSIDSTPEISDRELFRRLRRRAVPAQPPSCVTLTFSAVALPPPANSATSSSKAGGKNRGLMTAWP